MKKLDEIEARYSNVGRIEILQIAEDLGLLVRAVRHLGDVRNELEQLINESRGVDGIHLNGDLATWDELITGNMEEPSWLDAFSAPQDDVLALIDEAND